jgi:signal transduction histidine kinase
VQLESSASRKFQGTGLGLALVKHLAGLHGGAVWVESEPGRGSTFFVWIPYRRPPSFRETPA